MCGRFVRKSDPKRLAKEFGVAEAPEVEPSYNVAPTHSILAVRQDEDGRGMSFESLQDLLQPYPTGGMIGYPVSSLVNSPSNKGSELIVESQLNSA